MRRSRWTSIICFSKLIKANLVKVDEMMASLETTSEAQKNRRAVVFYMDRGKSGTFFSVNLPFKKGIEPILESAWTRYAERTLDEILKTFNETFAG